MNRTTGARLLVGLLAGIATLSACNSGGTSSTTTVTSSPTTATSTRTATSTSTSSTTTAPSTTEQTTTTTAPTTTVDPVAATKAAVAAAIPQTRVAYNYAVTNYDAPDALDVLAQSVVRDSPSWNLTVSNMDTLRSNGWLVRSNPDAPDESHVEGDVDLVDGPPATRAEATICTISSGVVYKPGAAPDGSDLIVNDEVNARRSRVTMVLQDGSWKIEQGTGLGSWEGSAECLAE